MVSVASDETKAVEVEELFEAASVPAEDVAVVGAEEKLQLDRLSSIDISLIVDIPRNLIKCLAGMWSR